MILGAVSIIDETGNEVLLAGTTENERRTHAKLLRVNQQHNSPHAIKTVRRHIRDGDIVLFNRQPTLHKSSIMAHYIRVLRGQKTIRMHYANCATYNADFDGDEMNVHFPQSQLARSEAMEIAVTDKQYITVRHGGPLRGLIQDHILSGVLLTKRDTFFTREDFIQLVYMACLEDNSHVPIRIPPPTMWKPRPVWTGKQVITTVLDHLTYGKAKLNMESKSKVPEDYWGKSMYMDIDRWIERKDIVNLISIYINNTFGLDR